MFLKFIARTALVVALLVPFGAAAAHAQGPPPPPPQGQWGPPPPNWDATWDRRPFPGRGACFFTSRDFGGHRFCMNAGQNFWKLPGNFGDNISSIQVFGGARVMIFNDRGFRGGSQMVPRNIRDLQRLRFGNGHTWNNRISSIRVF